MVPRGPGSSRAPLNLFVAGCMPTVSPYQLFWHFYLFVWQSNYHQQVQDGQEGPGCSLSWGRGRRGETGL